jgi:hypothetical protein
LVVVGGAAGLAPGHFSAAARLLESAVVPRLDDWDAAVVDGGTDSGVMQILGRARTAHAALFPLIGVTAEGTVAVRQDDGDGDNATNLEAHHTHALLVPGDSWGDESPWLSAVATVVAGDHPGVTMVINGGEITFDDVEISLAVKRPVIVVAGTGRAADAIAAAVSGRPDSERAERLGASPLVQVAVVTDPDGVAAALGAALGAPGELPASGHSVRGNR